jgi:hypothetical protein
MKIGGMDESDHRLLLSVDIQSLRGNAFFCVGIDGENDTLQLAGTVGGLVRLGSPPRNGLPTGPV